MLFPLLLFPNKVSLYFMEVSCAVITKTPPQDFRFLCLQSIGKSFLHKTQVNLCKVPTSGESNFF